MGYWFNPEEKTLEYVYRKYRGKPGKNWIKIGGPRMYKILRKNQQQILIWQENGEWKHLYCSMWYDPGDLIEKVLDKGWNIALVKTPDGLIAYYLLSTLIKDTKIRSRMANQIAKSDYTEMLNYIKARMEDYEFLKRLNKFINTDEWIYFIPKADVLPMKPILNQMRNKMLSDQDIVKKLLSLKI